MSETSFVPASRSQGQDPAEVLEGFVDAAILHAPHLDWHTVDLRVIRYLKTNVSGQPWMNHLALIAVVLASHSRVDQSTVRNRVSVFHVRWRDLFLAYGLVTFTDWKPSEHFSRYLNDPVLPDSLRTRQEFLRIYAATTHHIQVYLRSLPASQRSQYQQWELPMLPPGLRQQLYRGDEVVTEQRVRRKTESDALAPHFAQLRGEAHLRWNQLQRLRTKFREVVALVQSGQTTLPASFSYEEAGLGQRLHFLLWDRSTFVQSHADQYCAGTLWEARRKVRGFRPERNHFFLEFVGTEMGTNTDGTLDPHKLLWFGDLLRYNLLCMGPSTGEQEEMQQKQEYLHSWGYDTTEVRKPFNSDVAGLLAWPQADGSSNFMVHAQRRAKGILLLVEPLFAAATFGLAALDCFTTTGARVSELLQVSLTADCLYTMTIEGTQRLLLRLVPKGTDKLADYVIGSETRRNFEKVAHHREDEIIEQENWAFVRLEQVRRRGLGPETVKMEALIGRCKTEREEMQVIRAYRKDESYEPSLIVKRDK